MRGDLVTVALQGEFGKPRPALVIQANHFQELHTVTVLPVTSSPTQAPLLRVPVEPTPENGLNKPSHIMVDKVTTVSAEKLGPVFGRLDAETQLQVDRCVALFLGIAR